MSHVNKPYWVRQKNLNLLHFTVEKSFQVSEFIFEKLKNKQTKQLQILEIKYKLNEIE